MSQRALLLAVRDQLRTACGYANAECEVMFDGQPPPSAGERFVAVHPGEWGTEDIEGLKERYGIEVTVTVRVAKVPQDRIGVNALVGPTGKSLDDELEKIRAALHKDKGGYPVLAAANATIGAAANGFVEPLVFRSASRPEDKGPDWFTADTDYQGRLPPMGLAQTLSFAGAVRVQVIEEDT